MRTNLLFKWKLLLLMLLGFAGTALAQPANNECSSSVALTPQAFTAIANGCSSAVSGTTVAATQSTVPPSVTFSTSSDDDVWYEFTATQTGHYVRLCNVTFPVGTAAAMGITLHPGCTATDVEIAGVTVTLTAGSGETFFNNLTVGTTYKVRVLTSGTASRANFDISILEGQAQSYVSSTSTHPSTASVGAGTANAQILRVAVVTTGTLSPLTLTQLDFSTNGTTNAADITTARVYYTGTSTTFSTTTPFGTATTNPTGSFSVTGSQVLAGGGSNTTNYFFLVYDVACNASAANVIDAEVSSITVGGTAYTPTITAPTGTRAITTQNTATKTDPNGTTAVIAGSQDVQAARITIPAAPANCGTSVLTSLTANVNGTATSTDIVQAEVYYTTTTTFSTANPFGTAVVNPSGAITFTGNQTLSATSSNYFWLVYDVACSAVAANTLNADITSVTFGGNVITPTGTAPAANAIGGSNTTAKTDPNTTTAVPVGTLNATFSRIQVTGNTNCPGSLTSITATATAAAGDLASARVYYTTTTTFNTNTPFGTAVANPTTGTLTFTGNQSIATGANYFWLVYDVACTATPANTVNGDITSVVIGANTLVPTGTAAVANPIAALTVAKTDPNSTTAVPAGAQDVQSVYVAIPATSGCNNTVSAITINVNGTATTSDLIRAEIYYTNSTTFSNANLFGTAIANPATGSQTVTGTQALSQTLPNYFWLVYDVSCTATTSVTVNGDITGVTIDGALRTVTGTAPSANAVNANPTGIYYTSASGAWDNASTWACGSVPPSDITPVVIGHAITIGTNTPVAGSVTIIGGASLTINTGGSLTMGTSSTGAVTGNSNRILTTNGTLNIAGGILNLNGSAIFNAQSNLNMSSGTINVDPNDGTAAGSATVTSLSFTSVTNPSQVNVTGGNINFIDPPYPSGGSIYSIAASVAVGTDLVVGGTVTFDGNGGDDVNPANTFGFMNEGSVSSGSMEVTTLIIAGGRATTQRHSSTKTTANFLSKSRNLTVNTGAELLLNSEPLVIIGNLVNNGVITSTSTTVGQGLIFTGNATYNSGAKLTAATSGQTISGTGFFKVTTAAPDPTAQTGNLMGTLSVYHDTASAGLTLNIPLTISGSLQMLGGKVNTTTATPLALGNGTSIAGNGATLTATNGTLYGNSATGIINYNSGTTFATPQAYMGSWVTGPFSRFANGVTTGESGIMPIGSINAPAPAQIEFTTAPTTTGYLTGSFQVAPGTSPVNPPLTEPALTPSSINAVRNDIWQITQDAVLAGGTYNVTLNQRNAGLNDFTQTTIVKRADGSSPWMLEGTFVATAGSNNSPVLKRTGLTTFSQFAIAANNAAALPVKLAGISAGAIGKTNRVDWQSASEENAAAYEVERSATGNDFTTIGKVEALGHSAAYSFTDEAPFAGITYYRLRMSDINGEYSFSRVVTATQGRSATVAMSAYPNPAIGRLTVEVAGATEGSIVTLKDLSGKTLDQQTLVGNSAVFSVASLPAGIYFAVYTGSNTTQVIKVTKQ